MELADKLTIVIPTYNRPRYIIRAIEYWENLGVKTIVMDGSTNAIEQSQLNEFKNCSYFHKPIPFLERLKIAKDLVSTPYVSMIPDDEFFFASTIIKSIHVLETENIESCGGQCLRFSKTNNSITYSEIYRKLRSYNFLEDNGIERMKRHMLDYTPSTLYSIMKVDTWKKCMDLMTKRIVDVYAILEIQFEMAAVFHGKSKILPDVMWLRSDENKPVRNEPGMYIDRNFSNWWLDKGKNIEHEIIINDTLENFKSDNFDVIKTRKGIEEAFDNIVAFQKRFDGGISHKLAIKYPKLLTKINQLRNTLFPKVKTYSIEEIFELESENKFIIPKEELISLHKTINNFHFKNKL